MTALILVASIYPSAVSAKKCLYISSYHPGYAWSDGVERGLRSVLDGKCEIRQFNMDTKRNKQDEYITNKGIEAKQLIENWNPDIVITADDMAAKYVVQAHFKDHQIPFIFCGVNWSADEYGFPYSNVTGMIEVAPIYPLLEKVQALLPNAKKAIYIGADTLTEKKNLARFDTALKKKEIHLDSFLVSTVNEWLSAYSNAQEYDFIIIGSKSGINAWDQEKVVSAISKLSQKLSVTNHGWMMPYTMLGFTKMPEEQGEWAAQAALNVLDGIEISQIAIVPNRKWDIWTNLTLLKSSNVNLPEGLILKSKQVE
ncbi:MAG: ABC transporter substrate binding protein [Gammaproteobacteria bacterium]